MSRPSSPIALDSSSKIKSECSVLSSPVKVVKAGHISKLACTCVCVYVLCRVDALLRDAQELKMNNGIEE